MSKYITQDKETGSNTILSKPKDAPYVWSKGNAPTGGEGQIIPKSKVQTAETQAALKSLKQRQMQVMNTELGTWEDLS